MTKLLVQQAIHLGFFSKLDFDLAHFRQANRAANSCRVDRIFRWQVDRDQDCDGADACDDAGAEQLRLGRQVFNVWFGCVVHLSVSGKLRPFSLRNSTA